MTYVGDFPPCTHKFVVSSGVVLCERCGVFPASRATITTLGASSNPRNL
jgi:hypothetical protein